MGGHRVRMFCLVHILLIQMNCPHLKIRRFHSEAGFLASPKILEFLATVGQHVATTGYP